MKRDACTFCAKPIEGAPFYAKQCLACHGTMACCPSCAELRPALVRPMAVKIDLSRAHTCVTKAKATA
ncbi:MAG: hypothetical protein M3Q39_16820 [Actinomycetota bacterium]|nr:hypothetical protein [Actinomycetota bacterium]